MITGEQVKEAMMAANITTVDHHACGGCRYMTKYLRIDDMLFFDPGCYCTERSLIPEPRLWSSAADWINMQSNPEIRAELARAFGVEEIDRPGRNLAG